MKSTTKAIVTITLSALFIFACFASVFMIFAGLWIHTFNSFTEQTPVAEIQLSELKEDDLGEYFEVEVTQVRGRSPLASIFNPEDNSTDNLETPETFVMYGDEFGIGGPIVQFEDFLTLLNFETIYKLGFVEGVYTDFEAQNARTPEMPSRFELNDGYETWRNVYTDFQGDSIRSRLVRFFVKNIPQIDPQRVFVIDEPQELTLCITEDGFVFCE